MAEDRALKGWMVSIQVGLGLEHYAVAEDNPAQAIGAVRTRQKTTGNNEVLRELSDEELQKLALQPREVRRARS
jgi:hypothetical protein